MRSTLQPGLPHDLEREGLVLDGDVFPERDISREVSSHALDSPRAEIVVRESAVLVGMPVHRDRVVVALALPRTRVAGGAIREKFPVERGWREILIALNLYQLRLWGLGNHRAVNVCSHSLKSSRRT